MRAHPPAETTGDVGLSPELGRTFLRYLYEAGEHERGGVLLGQYEDWGISVSGAVFPPQLARARNHCAFDIRSIDVVRESITALTDQETSRAVGSIVGWVHSHPTWGLFLSNTDKDTFRSWISLDDRAVAVVADPFARDPKERIACWDKTGRRHLARIKAGSHRVVITIQNAAHLAQAITDHTAGGRWDVLVPAGIVMVFPPS